MTDNVAWRWMLRYKLFFLLGICILAFQVYLAYKSLSISDSKTSDTSYVEGLLDVTRANKKRSGEGLENQNLLGDDEDGNNSNQNEKIKELTTLRASQNIWKNGELGVSPKCDITDREAISALQRSKTKECRQQIANIACSIQEGQFYPKKLPNYCPTGNHIANTPLGCYRDEKKVRLLPDYFINQKSSNTPMHCIQICMQSGFPYAGVQYGSECFCGTEAPPTDSKLADSKCNMKCSGDPKDVCGGYFSMNVYETGIAKFIAQTAHTRAKSEIETVKIAFLLTLNGRALRQIHRLIKALYSSNHVFYIHVDARQDYLFRQLLDLEKKFTNIRLARKRFSTIWGGASLLTMLLKSMEDLLSSNWQWDFVINLSESDFPVKTVDKLVDFLSVNKGRNFVKSHGRETQRFIQKQGLDKTFVECETHMWRIGDRQLPVGIQIDGGSDWVALSRPFVEYVVRHTNSDELLKGLLIIFRHTLLPAESFFHTVLRNSQYCDTYVDNNLHVTNWKRKLGCKCQYKHVVDWCGCSPNDFKPSDWSRLQNTEHKTIFFARKFEPIVNQAIILQLEEWLFGPYTSDYINLNSYWQNFFSYEDNNNTSNEDVILTIAESLIRSLNRQLKNGYGKLLELNHYFEQEHYKGFLILYQMTQLESNKTSLFESRIRSIQYPKVAKNIKFAKRLRNFEVSSDFDQKEQISRNFAKLLGPYNDIVLSFTFLGGGSTSHQDVGHSYNLTILWIDPIGRLQDFGELHIEDSQTDTIHFSKPILKHPLMPGIWTVKLIGRAAIYAQTKFLISPLTVRDGKPITVGQAKFINGGSGSSLPADFIVPIEWEQFFANEADIKKMELLAEVNAQRTDENLFIWVDLLVEKFFHIRETCVVHEAPYTNNFILCNDSNWSSLAPDPKSDINVLLKLR